MDPQAVKPLYETIHRYAGWLDRERSSVLVRADVEALGTAIDACADPLPLLVALDIDLGRLPSGAVRKMMRAASAKLRRAVANEQD